MNKILYTAAHSGFNLGEVPLGGGASICQHLIQEWMKTQPFEWAVLGPSLLGSEAPQHKDLVRYSEFEYARFCRRFEERITGTILRHDPKSTVVLSNDVSEGPDFTFLASKGYPLFTIYHVDVVDYFAAIYLRGLVKPESTTAFFHAMHRSGLSRIFPKMLHLIWEKQEASVRYSKGLIVPSARMKEVLIREYPRVDPGKIHVLPWGAWDDPVAPEEVAREKEALQKTYPSSPEAWTLLMLSRISPEKGQDRLLKALTLLEKENGVPEQGIRVFISGEAAYMMGKRYEEELKRLAAWLKRCRVHFVGYAAPARKKALFDMSDLYVFPSRHESYGLTLLEALRAGLPVLATPSYGAREVFQPSFGDMIAPSPEARTPELIKESLKRLLLDRSHLRKMGDAASSWARRQNFSDSAARLAELLVRL
jgi:glycosyltransferase involved in cell wall biosynthesis